MVLVTESGPAQSTQAPHDDRSDIREMQLASEAARRLVSQCRAHVEKSNRKIGDRVNGSVAGTPCRIDFERAKSRVHPHAFDHQLKRLEAMSNALISHLHGLQVLMSDDTFYPLPAMAIARSIAEVSSAAIWGLRPGLSPDERAVRSYASLFAMLERGVRSGGEDSAPRTREIREELVASLANSRPKVHVVRRVKDAIQQDDVAQVQIGKASAKVQFQYSQRLMDEIPIVGGLYDQMSAATHGDHAAVSASFDTPASYARGIAQITLESTKAWSLAVHTWIGITPAMFWNETDLQNLRNSIPAEERAEFEAELHARTVVASVDSLSTDPGKA